MQRTTSYVVAGLLSLLPLPAFATQSFVIAFDTFQDVDGDGRIDCGEPVTYRIGLSGTAIAEGGDRGVITVPFSVPIHWSYEPGSFAFDPIFSNGCTYSIDSGNAPADPRLVLHYACDPRSGNPEDDTYTFSFRIDGIYVSSTIGSIVVDAQNVRTFPDSQTQIDQEASTPPLEPCPPPPDLRLTKRLTAGNGDPGTTLVYTLSLSNLGGAAAGVTLEEHVPDLTTFTPAGSSPGWTCSPNTGAGAACVLPLGNIAAGASLTRTFAVVVDAALPSDPGMIGNTACVTTTTPGDPDNDNCGTVTTPPGGHPDLEVVKMAKSGTTTPGDTLVYQLELTNRGSRAAADAVLRETVPPATTWVAAASSPGWSCSGTDPGSACFLPIGTVAAGASLRRDFAVRIANPLPPGTTEIANTGCVDAGASDPPANNCSTVTQPPGGNPDLHLVKSLASGTLGPDAVLVFELTLTNEGNRAAASAALTETVPADTTFEPTASSPGWTCSPGPGAGSTCTLAVGTVAAGSSSTHRFAVRVRSGIPPEARITNTACATGTPADTDPPGNNCSTVIVDPPLRPKTDLELSLAVDQAFKQVGDEFAFVLTVRNTSAVAARNLRITVMLPNFGTPPAGIDAACHSISDLGLDCSLPGLAPGEQVGLTWFQAAFQAGTFVVAADLAEAQPDDIDSIPGNAVRNEDDYAEVTVQALREPVLHDVPTLSPGGLIGMSGTLLACGIAFLITRRQRQAQTPPPA
jgi:uncharacterized repeat protein (TIGR01451 family)